MEHSKKIVVIRANPINRETRATKIIKTLSKNKYKVSLISWDRGDVYSSRDETSEAGPDFINYIYKLKSPWGPSMLLKLPFWWIFIIYTLFKTDWDAVHVIQIINLPPALLVSLIKRKKVVYDILDVYEDSILLPLIVRNILVSLDKIMISLTDAVILSDEEIIRGIGEIDNPMIEVIYDSPDTIVNLDFTKYESKYFNIFYAGSLTYSKHLNLDKMVEAIKDLPNTKLTIAGHGDMVPQIKHYSKHASVEYIGAINHAEVLQRSINSDLLFVIRDSVLPVNRYICGSKFLEALLCETPIIGPKDTSTGDKIVRENVGFAINPHDIVALKHCIMRLRKEPDLRLLLRANANKAWTTKYSWKIMEYRLVSLYDKILSEINLEK